MKRRFFIAFIALLLSACAISPPPGGPYAARTDASFGAVQLGKTTRDAIRQTFGPPDESMHLSLRDMDVWSYRYKQSGVWDAMMHVHFDRQGVVREMMSGPDPEKEERRSFFR